jgi:hypothetical protein
MLEIGLRLFEFLTSLLSGRLLSFLDNKDVFNVFKVFNVNLHAVVAAPQVLTDSVWWTVGGRLTATRSCAIVPDLFLSKVRKHLTQHVLVALDGNVVLVDAHVLNAG